MTKRPNTRPMVLLSAMVIASMTSIEHASAGPIVFASVWAGDYTSHAFTSPTSQTWDTTQPWQGDVVSSQTDPTKTALASNGGSHKGAITSSSGSANLSTAELKASESATLSIAASATNARAQVNAAFGDGFSVFEPGGGLFSWTSADTVRFTLTVDGHIGSATPNDVLGIDFGFGAPGALANAGKPLGSRVPAGLVTGGFLVQDLCSFGLGSNESLLGFMTCGGSLTKSVSGDVSGTIFAEFAPNGNFDWFAGLHLVGAPSGGPGMSDMDFLSTITVAYQGPSGSTTFSQSGVFPGTLAAPATVPEPASFMLLALGIAAVAGHRRSRSRTRKGKGALTLH